MQIKPIMAATGVLACALLAWPPLVLVAPNAFGAAVNDDGQIAAAGDIFSLQATEADDDDEPDEVAENAELAQDEGEEIAGDEAAAETEVDAVNDTDTKGEDEVNATADEVEEVIIPLPQVTQIPKPATTVSNRKPRPQTKRHKDARACLNAGDNQAIIRCAEKYRY